MTDIAHHTTLVSPATLASHLGDPQWIILDCRFVLSNPTAGREAHALSHIPGAQYIDLETQLSAPKGSGTGRHPLPAPEALAATLGGLGIGPDCQVVAYDDAYGSMASRLWWLMRWIGHDAVAVLDGGLPVWKRNGLPLTADSRDPVPRELPVGRCKECTAQAPEVLDAVLSAASLILDARPEERFEGFVEPFDPVPGHVPGAVNLPYEDNLAFSGLFLSPEELRDLYGQVLGSRTPAQVVHMCGSGVTACMNILAMEHAGLFGSRLYAGSWSEWITDPDRPIASNP